MALAGGAFWLFARLRELPPEELTNRLLVFLLWWFDLTLIAVLLFMLLRNLTKLALERHHGVFGSRFRAKLVLSYLVLIFGPTLLVFLLSASLLSHAAARWFSEPVEEMAAQGTALATGLRAQAEARARRAATTVARELARVGEGRAARLATLERLHALLGNHLTGLWRDGATVVELQDPRAEELRRLPALAQEALASSGQRSERAGGTLVVRAWEVMADGSVVVVGEALPPELVAAQARLAAAGAAYQQLKLQRTAMTATMVLGFGGFALLVVFAAVWLGLHLSRRFTAPLLSLVASTERAARGETLEEVPLPADDEVGLLVESFNAMVRRLKEKEAALQETVHRLDTVLRGIRTGVLTMDRERTSVIGNPAAAALLGMPQLASRPLALEELAAAGNARLVETLRSAAGPVRGSVTVEAAGVARALELAVLPLGDAAQPQGWVVALEDLTQLLRAQRQAAWSEVARRIAHQIKNPLTPIRLAAERIARHAERGGESLSAVVPQGCAAIVEHVQAMQEMVDAFALYAKLPPVSLRPTHLGQLVTQLATLYDGLRPNLHFRVQDHLGDQQVMADPEQLRQALANLFDNAAEASPDGGEVVISLARSENEITITVADRGAGIDGSDPELLFQPFYSTKGRGSGIGLAVVQRIVADHGGTVRLLPREGGGVEAVVTLPLD
jgi:nitrogen fixation/metabolism regulation signal transduction histidine kinase